MRSILRRLAIPCACACALAACSTLEAPKPPARQTQVARKGAEPAPSGAMTVRDTSEVTPAPARGTDPATEPAQPTAVREAAASPLGLAITTEHNQTSFARGEQISLIVRLSRDAHLYCYLQDENARLMRFFPNRFVNDSFVSAAEPLLLPGKMRFQLAMNNKGANETISCFATPRDVLAELPAQVVGVDFEALPASSMQQVRAAFAEASSAALAQENFHVQSR